MGDLITRVGEIEDWRKDVVDPKLRAAEDWRRNSVEPKLRQVDELALESATMRGWIKIHTFIASTTLALLTGLIIALFSWALNHIKLSFESSQTIQKSVDAGNSREYTETQKVKSNE